MEYIVIQVTLDSSAANELHIYSIRICSRKLDIFENPLQQNFNPYVSFFSTPNVQSELALASLNNLQLISQSP